MKKIFVSFLLGLLISSSIYAQVEVNITCTAGNLNTLLSEQELLTTTHIVLQGNIDSRDFKTMKDSMPELLSIDMSSVTIESYEGPNGSYGAQRSYKADEIPFEAFSSTLEKLILPDNLQSFSNSAMYGTDSLETVVIPPLVKTIDEHGFAYCGIKTLTIPSTVDSIKDYAFNFAKALKNLTIEEGVKYIGKGGFYYAGEMENLLIPHSLNTLGDDAFFYSQIRNITFLSDSLDLGNNAFYSCKNLRSVEFNTKKAVLRRQAFYNCDSIENLSFGNGIDSIYSAAFINCMSISNHLTIPSSCKFIDDVAFNFCKNLPGITLQEGVKHIGNMAFGSCYGLKDKLVLPEGISNIDPGAFISCTALETIVFPKEIGAVGSAAFMSCKAINDIWVTAVTPLYFSDELGVFPAVDTPNINLHIPYGTRAMYDTASTWKHFNIVEYAELNVSRESVTLSFQESTNTFDIQTNAYWQLSTSDDWITVNRNTGNGNATISFSVEANELTELRMGTITVNALSEDQTEILSSAEIHIYQIGAMQATQQIQLEQGWNLVSVYVVAESMSIEDLFSSQVSLVKNFDGFWNGSFVSTIDEIEPGEGYFVYSDVEQTISITGIPTGL